MEAEERGWIRRRMEGEREKEGGRKTIHATRYLDFQRGFHNRSLSYRRNHLFVRSSDLPPDRTLRDIPAITR